MSIAIYLTFVFGALFGGFAPVLGRALPPAVNTWLLSAGAVLAASASTACLALLAATLVGSNPDLAARGHWSLPVLQRANPVPPGVAVLAALVLGALAVRCAACFLRRRAAVLTARRLAAALPAAGGELVVVVDPDRLAYAVPGRPGRIVVSTGLLRGLDGAQRRAVLAHERTHLAHRHHLHIAVTDICRAANPLLWTLPSAVRLSTERWADEAAAATTPRQQVADALLRAATVAGSPARPDYDAVLAAAQIDLAQRVAALRAPAPRVHLWRVGLIVVCLCATAATTLHAATDTDHLFDHARSAYQHRLGPAAVR